MMLMQTGANVARDLAHRLRGVLLLGACLILALVCGQALAQASSRNFDHVKTGFPLTGTHTSARCESCHLNGVFKGTPKDCASCHTSGFRMARGNTIKPADHIQTQLACDSCHNTQVFTGARFNHMGVAPGSCSSCHNGSSAPGKPTSHIVTQSSCDSCHTTSAWTPARGFDHSGVVAGTCGSCHNGSRAIGKNAAHIPVSGNACDSCHQSTRGWKPTNWNHTQTAVASQCSSCHSGAFPPADGRPANHIPYQAISGVVAPNCDTCHKGSFAAWVPARLHSNVAVTAQCSSCHNGSFPPAVGKPATPVHANAANCESCHKTSGWTGAKVDHGTFTAATNCASCHNGSSATGKSGSHVPVGATNCVSCHSTTSWKPSRFNHTQVSVAAQCSSCHSGAFPPADGRPANHIPYQTIAGVVAPNCDTCHKGSFAAWAPARFHSNVAVSAQCSSCHNGSFAPAVGKPATPIHTGVTNCESCHQTSGWAGARVNHSTFTAATNCASCHNGSSATGKPAAHIPVGATNCIACHTTSSWRPSRFNHTQVSVTAQCSTCHSGAFPPADARPVTHIPYQLLTGVAIVNCDTCHKGGFAAWTPARFHGNVSVSNQCASCHTGLYSPARGKPNTPAHVGVTTCESCHRSTASWLTVVFAHSPANAVGTGTCDNCHNGVSAKGKPATHIPVPAGVAKCDSCHRSQSSFATATMNHSVVTTATCKSCHNGSYVSQGTIGALAKPANHIPEAQLLNGAAMDCKACHVGTTSWVAPRMNHNGSLGGAAGSCKACHASGTNFLGNMDRKALTHQNKTPPAIDCSESGCHRPLGNRGTAYTRWN